MPAQGVFSDHRNFLVQLARGHLLIRLETHSAIIRKPARGLYRKTWLGPRTPVGNLYLTGSDVALLGIMGALMGAVVTASCLLGRLGFIEVMRAARSRS